MKSCVYVETSIFSFLTARPSSDIRAAAWQKITFDWWKKRSHLYNLYVSELVYQEASRGDANAASKRIAALVNIPHLEINSAVVELAQKIVAPGPLPQKAAGDAIHLALAAIHKIDFLLTWNCRHLDNAEIKLKIRKLLSKSNVFVPEICTPQELMGVY